jgi:transcriptional regulator with XRE-family HTH domain
MTERVAFGSELRRARERRGLTLEQISGLTKVSISHFAGLERGDISKWPSGIFRRAFIRNYAVAVGLDPDETVARFGLVFPDPTDGARPAARVVPFRIEAPESHAPAQVQPADGPALRLVLDPPEADPRPGTFAAAGRRALAGGIDVLLAMVPAAVMASLLGRDWFWLTAACAGLIGHLAFYAIAGTTPGAWLLARGRAPRPSVDAVSPAQRRSDADPAPGARRHAPRHASNRPATHAHRVRH